MSLFQKELPLPDISKKGIWIASEFHRRSYELAKSIGCPFYPLLVSDEKISVRVIRYFYYLFKLIQLLGKEKPSILFVQNPSLVLTFYASLLKDIFNYKLVVDRHSNFKLDKKGTIKWRTFHAISNYTLRKADITIVTNDHLKRIVDKRRGYGFILQDRIPDMSLAEQIDLGGQVNIVFVCSFSFDEPIIEIFSSAELLPRDWKVYITGHFEGKKKYSDIIKNKPKNVILIGFLPEKDYQTLLNSCDIVVVLTTEEYLLTCGAYEAISLGKVLILSDTQALRSYFNQGPIFTKNEATSIKNNIILASRNKKKFRKNITALRKTLIRDWNIRFRTLMELIDKK